MAVAEDQIDPPLESLEVKPDEPEVTPAEEIDQLVPHFTAQSWTLADDERSETYIQKPMSWVAKLRFYAMVGDTIDLAMRGEGGLTLDGVLGMAGSATRDDALLQAMGMNRQQGIDALINGLAKLARFVPDLLLDCYCLWLNIPEGDWDWAKSVMSLPEDEGGLSDEDGMVIVETFVDQNSKAMRDFFAQRAPQVWTRILDRMNLTQAPEDTSRSSRRSKRSGPRTRQSR